MFHDCLWLMRLLTCLKMLSRCVEMAENNELNLTLKSECICTHFLLKIWLRKQLKLNYSVFFNMQWHQCEFKVSGYNINRSFWRLSWLTGKLRFFFSFIYLFLNNKTLIRHFQIIKNRSVQFLDKSCVSSFLGVSFLFTVSLHFPELGITLLPHSEAL